jgi:hypothetical protein
VANPSASLSDQNSLISNPNIVQKTIEVMYNCVDGKKGFIHMNMTVSIKGCPVIALEWIKVCKPYGN